MSNALHTLALLAAISLSVSEEMNKDELVRRSVGASYQWRCFRAPGTPQVPGTLPCLNADKSTQRRSWYFDVTSAICRMTPRTNCPVTDVTNNIFMTLDDCIRTCLPGLGALGHDMKVEQDKNHKAAMRTITVMLPVRYNEVPSPFGHEPFPDGRPSHGPLNGQLLGGLGPQSPFVIGGWSAQFDVPPSRPAGDDSKYSAGPGSDAAHIKHGKHASSSSLPPGFIFHLLTDGRYLLPPHGHLPAHLGLPGLDLPHPDGVREHQDKQEVHWRPEQLVQRYMDLRQPRRQGEEPRSDGLLKNDVVMTAISYGLVGGGDRSSKARVGTTSQSTTSTTTPATTDARRKKKFSAEYLHRTSGRYRSYPFTGRGRLGRRRFDSSSDSDVVDDEILEALFGYDQSPVKLRRVRRPPSSLSARREYGRQRFNNAGGEVRRRWRNRPISGLQGKLRRRTGSRATPSDDGEKQAKRRSRRPTKVGTSGIQRTKSDVGSDTEASGRLSLLHIVVSRQQDFAAPPPPPLGFMDHPGVLEPRPRDMETLGSLGHHPFIEQSPAFSSAVHPVISDIHARLPHRKSKESGLTKVNAEVIDRLTNSTVDNICTLPVSIGDCKSYQNKWYFNHKVGRCDMFFYGGCGGNGNRFETLEHCLRTCALRLAAGGAERIDSGSSGDVDQVPPGAADSWINVDEHGVDNEQEELTTSKPTDVIIVTSPVYVPMVGEDLEPSERPVDVDITLTSTLNPSSSPESTRTQHPGSLTSRHVIQPTLTSHDGIAPTLPSDDAVVFHEKMKREKEDSAIIPGLSRPYIAIVIILGVVGIAIVILITVIALHVCCKVRRSKKAEILEEVIKAHTYGELSKVVYNEPPTSNMNEKL